MAKIAVTSGSNSRLPGTHPMNPPRATRICAGNGWTISEIVCNAGPSDHPFEEQHTGTSIAFVVSGSFQYRSSIGHALLTPGSLLLGNPGDCFTCGHDHGIGDRCLSISYTDEIFGTMVEEAGFASRRFRVPRIPPVPELTRLTARMATLLHYGNSAAWEDFCFEIGAQVLGIAEHTKKTHFAEPSSLARVTRVIRALENDPDTPHDLRSLAAIARLSPFHFLRTFRQLIGTTPHQYLLRLRLRNAATRLASEKTNVADIAFSSGFGDVSNFNRAFRTEFGMSPRVFKSRYHSSKSL